MTMGIPSTPPVWLAEFIGVPYVEGGYTVLGWSCWGPVYEAYRRIGVELPTYGGQRTSLAAQEEIAELVNRDRGPWVEIPVTAAKLFDVLTFRLKGRWHCGLVLDPPYFLHCLEDSKTVRERWDSVLWRHTLTGAYRYVGKSV